MKITTIKRSTIGAHKITNDISPITQDSLKDLLIQAVKRNAVGTEKNQVEKGNSRTISEIINRKTIYQSI